MKTLLNMMFMMDTAAGEAATESAGGLSLLEEMWNGIVGWVSNPNNWFSVLAFFIVLICGLIVVKVLKKVIAKSFDLNKKINNTLKSFLLSIIGFGLYLVLIVVLAMVVGVDTTSLAAVLGSVGLALSLALQDSLGSIANGIIILFNKPFVEGDYIAVDGIEGTVQHIHVISTELLTPDNKKIFVPNSHVTGQSVINYSAEKIRRVAHDVNVAYDTDVDKLAAVLEKIVKSDSRILKDPDYALKLTGFGSSELQFSLRYWVNTGDYWDVLFDTNNKLLLEFRKAGIEIPFQQMDVNIKK